MTALRDIETYIKKISKIYEVITLTGPRQSGKTTLVKKIFKDKPYVNLENPRERDFALEDPEGFLARFKDGAVIDEIQRAPDLFSYIQVIVDERKMNSMFILTGSQNFALLEQLTQSLAGRTGLVKLLPFSCNELKKNYKIDLFDVDNLIFTGFYPKIYDKSVDAQIILEDYIQTYLERDLRDSAKISDLSLFRKFMKMCAARVGQVLNMRNISEDLGVSQPTVKSWLHLLEMSYVIYLHPSYNANINKQLVKAPKLYFYDVGLASLLLDIRSPDQVSNHSMRGSLFENLVIVDLLKYFYNQGIRPSLFYYRDKRKEVDLVYKEAETLRPIEIKSAETVSSSFFDSLEYFEALFPKQCVNKTLVTTSSQEQNRDIALITNHVGLLKSFSS